MTWRVRILARARRDVESIVAWIAERSPTGADRRARSFEAAIAGLERNPLASPLAVESEELGEAVRNILFRTTRGRAYRPLFIVADDEVRILRVRGSGQPPITSDDLGT